MPIEAEGPKAMEIATQRMAQVLIEAYGKSNPNIDRALDALALRAVNRVKLLLSDRGSGRTYRRGTRTHVASSPGEPPSTDTGRLRSSYTWQRGRNSAGPYVDIGTNVEYAPFLEFGTSRMAPRPHLRPALEAEADAMQETLIKGLTASIRTTVHKHGGTG